MRVRLTLSVGKNEGLILPTNYNHLVQAAIYHNISRALADFLHERGFLLGKRRFKLFTFSRLEGRYMLDRTKKQFVYTSDLILYISSPVKKFIEDIANTIVKRGFLFLGNNRLNVAEVFKPIIVDRVIFTLVNKKMLDASCFMEELGGLYLNDKGRKTFVQEYESKLKQTITCARKLKASYKRLIRLELYKLEKHLIGDKEYEPFVAQW
jgi:CRISPR-associated endoribonuclease Cas6